MTEDELIREARRLATHVIEGPQSIEAVTWEWVRNLALVTLDLADDLEAKQEKT